MKTAKLIGIFPLVLIAASSFAQGDNHAVPRSGGGGSSHSDSGSRHTGGGGSSSSSSAGSSSSSSHESGSSASQGSDHQSSRASDAASRRPRPGTGTGNRDRYGNNRDRYYTYPYSNYYYNPYSYSRGYGLYGYGYGYGYNDYGYSYGDYYGYYPSYSYGSYRYRSGNVAQLRTLVEPVKTRVYVDGYYAGIADDFDGLLQRLNISPGRHDITLRLEGYTSHTFSVYGNRDQTVKLRWDMVKGSGETRDTVGEEYDRRDRDADRERDEDRDRDRDADRDRDRDRDIARERDSERAPDRSREVDSDNADRRYVPPSRESHATGGEVLLDIEPADASVYVDGEFYGKASQLNRIELPAGRHKIEVVRPGFKTEETEVNVEGEAKRVVVKLGRR